MSFIVHHINVEILKTTFDFTELMRCDTVYFVEHMNICDKVSVLLFCNLIRFNKEEGSNIA